MNSSLSHELFGSWFLNSKCSWILLCRQEMLHSALSLRCQFPQPQPCLTWPWPLHLHHWALQAAAASGWEHKRRDEIPEHACRRLGRQSHRHGPAHACASGKLLRSQDNKSTSFPSPMFNHKGTLHQWTQRHVLSTYYV